MAEQLDPRDELSEAEGSPSGVVPGQESPGRAMIHIKIPGIPQGKKAPLFGRTWAGKPNARKSPKTQAYEEQISWLARGAMAGEEPLSGPIGLILVISMPVPPSYSVKRRAACLASEEWPGKPDVDNVMKAVCDGCNKIVFKDDSQICFVQAVKHYGDEAFVFASFSSLIKSSSHLLSGMRFSPDSQNLQPLPSV